VTLDPAPRQGAFEPLAARLSYSLFIAAVSAIRPRPSSPIRCCEAASLPRLLRRNDHPDASLVAQTHMEPTNVEEKQKGQKGKKDRCKSRRKGREESR
jgi:hypothetical protein